MANESAETQTAEDEEIILGRDQQVEDDPGADTEHDAPGTPLPDQGVEGAPSKSPGSDTEETPGNAKTPMVPRDLDEVLRQLDLANLSDADRAKLLARHGGTVDDSVDRANLEFIQNRELASRANVIRIEPEEHAPTGTEISGMIRSFKAPFKIERIKDWLLKVHGGGKYQIVLKQGNGDFGGSETFRLAGPPKLPVEGEEEEDTARQQVAATDDRAAALERQLQEERFERRMSEMQGRQDTMNERILHAMGQIAEAAKEKPEPEPVKPPIDFAGLLSTAAPVPVDMYASRLWYLRWLPKPRGVPSRFRSSW